MKFSFSISLTLVAILISINSCSEQELIETSKQLQSPKSTIIIGGEAIYAGYGYDPAEDRAFRNAIEPENIYESTDIQPALEVQVSKINERRDIEEHNKETYTVTRKKKSFFGLFKRTHTSTRTIETYVKINKESISVIAKVKAQHQRFYVDDEPVLTRAAQRLIDAQQYERFLDNYGPYYVSSRTTGGEVQYIYNYSYCKIDRWSKQTLIEKAKSNVLFFFGKSSSTTITDEDKKYLEQAQESVHLLSSVPGYAPQMIRSVEDANIETQRLQDYLRDNPQKAITMAMDLKPYSEFIANDKLEQLADQKEHCLKLTEAYELQYDRLHYVYENAIEASKKEEAKKDMDQVTQTLNNITCTTPIPSLESIFDQKYGDTMYSSPCEGFINNFELQLRVYDYSGNSTGELKSTLSTNQWSLWASDGDYDKPDRIQIGIERTSNKPLRLMDTDYRIAIQSKEWGGNPSTIQYTPWASEGAGWSDWSIPSGYCEAIRVMVETKPLKGFFIEDIQVGIQVLDYNGRNTEGIPEFSPWLKNDGGGISDYSGSYFFKHLDGVRVYMGVKLDDYATDKHSFDVRIALSGEGTSMNSGGPTQYTQLPNVWSIWAGDRDNTDPKYIRVELYQKNYKQAIPPNTDYRLAIQMADDIGMDEYGIIKYTPWASEGGGWSNWASDKNNNNFDMVRIMIEKRYKKEFNIKDIKIGIQAYENNVSSDNYSPINYTSWFSKRGSSTPYTGRDSFTGLDYARIYLETIN